MDEIHVFMKNCFNKHSIDTSIETEWLVELFTNTVGWIISLSVTKPIYFDNLISEEMTTNKHEFSSLREMYKGV